MVNALLFVLADELATEVGGEDNQGILKVDGATFVVGQATIIKHLQQHIEHIGVRLLNLIK